MYGTIKSTNNTDLHNQSHVKYLLSTTLDDLLLLERGGVWLEEDGAVGLPIE